jgi:hypothetical protein
VGMGQSHLSGHHRRGGNHKRHLVLSVCSTPPPSTSYSHRKRPDEDPHNGTWTVSTPTALPGKGTISCYISNVEMDGP